MTNQPGLFGIHHSNKNFSNPVNWGKNQFNNAFPIALCCYMSHIGLKPIFITLNKELKIQHQKISVSDLFRIDPASPEVFFAFEHNYFPYQRIVEGSLESADVVISNKASGRLLRGLEIKLTALPDTTTCQLLDQEYGCELVVRPNTISYVALSIANSVLETGRKQELQAFLEPVCGKIRDWTDEKMILPILDEIKQAICQVFISDIYDQQPVIVQPVWKTVGKSSQLHEDCLDVFVWSDLALAWIPMVQAKISEKTTSIQRPARSIVWLAKMLYDFSKTEKINPSEITNRLNYQFRNDKSFSASGKVTHRYMTCPELTQPRVKRSEVKNIILNGGQRYLSPERRFDAIIVNTPGLFN
jgi:hypothetical protein